MMKKLKTHINGLDELFHGGIQIDCKTKHAAGADASIVIAVRGEQGTNKHLFAMQLMHGLTKSMRERDNGEVGADGLRADQYFSINKATHGLEDMYLDLLISRWIYHMTKAIKRQGTIICDKDEGTQHNPGESGENCGNGGSINHQQTMRVNSLRFWFEKPGDGSNGGSSAENRDLEYREYIDMLADSVANYNVRTNSIHYRRLFPGDSNENCLLCRRHDSVRRYVQDYTGGEYAGVRGYTEKCENVDYSFSTDFIDMCFNRHSRQRGKNEIIARNSREALASFQKILRHIESEVDNAAKKRRSQQSGKIRGGVRNRNSEKILYDAVVIDGFSHIDTESLRTLPYSHLYGTLRNYARVSILVFDDRKEEEGDEDIVIDLRVNTDDSQEYTYHELQISKSVFQTRALGWHQYKRRDYGIVVFPSIHLRLTRRYYVSNLLNEIGKGMLENTYMSFLASRFHGNPDDAGGYDGLLYDEYVRGKEDLEERLLWNMYVRQEKEHGRILSRSRASGEPESHETDDVPFDGDSLLHRSLFGSEASDSGDPGYCVQSTHSPVTAIVGNPNSFKRLLVLSKAFHWAKKGQHVLFVLFDKDETDIRRQMLCPAIRSRIKACGAEEDFKAKSASCRSCCRFIHFLSMRPGCITAEEFLSVLLEQILIYCDSDIDNGMERRKLHVVIDDFQRIDFSFPFIKNTTLFTSGLINMCREHNVELTILCDKSSERAHEVCTLADNVMCIQRERRDTDSFNLFSERIVDPPLPSSIVRYRIEDALDMFTCDDELHIRLNHRITPTLVGSMKDYWRKTVNVGIKR